MLGAIIGDIAGSRFEWDNIKSKEFEFFHEDCAPTDDSYMTLAIMQALLDTYHQEYSGLAETAVKRMREFGLAYPDASYGGRFYKWLRTPSMGPYNSFGNGAAMRVSPCGMAAKSVEEARLLADEVTKVTHNSSSGMKAGETIAVAIFLARQGNDKEYLRKFLRQSYAIYFTLDEIRDDYVFDVTCDGSVPEAMEAFLESESYEDAIRNAISIGGDSDTIASMCGGLAEAYHGIDPVMQEQGKAYLDEYLRGTLDDFYNLYG